MRTIVIGGGLGGLVTAVLLAERGVEVTVLERTRTLGGRARTDDQDGWLFNLGPHAIYRTGPADLILQRLGVRLRGAAPNVKGFLLSDGALHTLPTGPLSLLTTGFLDAGARWELGKLLARPRFEARGDETVGDWLARTLRTPRAREVVRMLLRIATYTEPPDELRAKDALVQLRIAVTAGVLYVDGGWQTIATAVAARAEKAGVRMVTGAHAERLRREGGGFVLDVRGGEGARADRVVLALGPHAASSLLPEDAELARVAAAAVPVEAACLDVALEELPRASTTLFGANEPYYAVVHSTSAKLAPADRPGAAVVHVMKYLAPGASATRPELEELLERLQPGAKVHHARFTPRLVVQNWRATAARGGLDGRIVRPATDGVALVGDWVGPRGMLLDAALGSADAAAEALAPARARTA
jgi:phytoene dehydrogenase-like protein